jgi:hypothetical protein
MMWREALILFGGSNRQKALSRKRAFVISEGLNTGVRGGEIGAEDRDAHHNRDAAQNLNGVFESVLPFFLMTAHHFAPYQMTMPALPGVVGNGQTQK